MQPDAARGEQDRAYFDMQIQLESHTDLLWRRGYGQDVGPQLASTKSPLTGMIRCYYAAAQVSHKLWRHSHILAPTLGIQAHKRGSHAPPTTGPDR
jgi:hypothetical protein